MQTFKLQILSPERFIFDGEAISAIFPGAAGSFEILPNHASIISMIKAGKVEITDTQKQKHEVEVGEGFFEFHQKKGVLLSI